jgi:PleD family two-component response regulator
LLTDLGSRNGTFVDGEVVRECMINEGPRVRTGQTTILRLTYYDAAEEAAQRRLLDLALRDGLTGAFNRRYFMQQLNAEIRFADRHRQMLALLMLDIDHFKRIIITTDLVIRSVITSCAEWSTCYRKRSAPRTC